MTLLIAKSVARLSRVTGRGRGDALPGLLADRLDPTLLRTLCSQLPHGVVVVTGTNGKTTVTRLLADMLRANGERVLTNATGSNLRRGLVSALIADCDHRGRTEASIGVFEVDEATLPLVAADLGPSHLVVLNLFRDQLDRYGELDRTAALIGAGIAATDAQLHLNADDPQVARLACHATRPRAVRYFGIDKLPDGLASSQRTPAESTRCPKCRREMRYQRVFHGHTGHYSCPSGHFARPEPEVAVTEVHRSDGDGSAFSVSIAGVRQLASLPLPGTYNVYNAVAALSVGHGLGIASELAVSTLSTATSAFGRVDRFRIRGRQVVLLLIKNPAGFIQVLETFLSGTTSPHVFLAVNDNAADGRDVSWLWDVPLESIAPVEPVWTTGGTRAIDMALRLKYAGAEAICEADLTKALDLFVSGLPAGETGYVLPTYTAMLDLRRLLLRESEREAVLT